MGGELFQPSSNSRKSRPWIDGRLNIAHLGERIKQLHLRKVRDLAKVEAYLTSYRRNATKAAEKEINERKIRIPKSHNIDPSIKSGIGGTD